MIYEVASKPTSASASSEPSSSYVAPTLRRVGSWQQVTLVISVPIKIGGASYPVFGETQP